MTSVNTLKTVALLGLLSAILIVGGGALAGRNGMYFGLALAVVTNFVSYFYSERIALSMYNAQPVTPTENPDVYRRVQPMVASLCQRMGLPMPKLFAFAGNKPFSVELWARRELVTNDDAFIGKTDSDGGAFSAHAFHAAGSYPSA